ncbi:MAG: penicillin-binding protein 2 [bacterium]|nr:penicillin-binding protein 2 [bacterium]
MTASYQGNSLSRQVVSHTKGLPIKERHSILQGRVSNKLPKPKRFETPDIEKSLRCGRLRQTVTMIIFAAWVGVIAHRLLVVQNVEYAQWLSRANDQHERLVKVQTPRGDIVDRDGRPLALSIPATSVAIHSRNRAHTKEIAKLLGSIIDITAQDIIGIVGERKGFTWLGHDFPGDVYEKIGHSRIKNVSAFRNYNRAYPQGDLARAILGRVGQEGGGLSGIELSFDQLIRSQSWKREVRRDARGRIRSHGGGSLAQVSEGLALAGVALTGEDTTVASPEDVKLTIDSVIQGIVEDELSKGVHSAKAKSGFAVVMDSFTGEIMAMASANGQRDSGNDLRNAVVQDVFEPGSTLKPIVAALALKAGVVTGDENYDVSAGRVKIGRHWVRDAHPNKILSFEDVIVLSSNVGMTKIAANLGPERLYNGLSEFGFGQKSGVLLPGESAGILRPVSQWRDIDFATASFGQGVAVNALQMVAAYGVFANGGYQVKPHIVLSGAESEKDRTNLPRILSDTVVKRIDRALHQVIVNPRGTGKGAALDDFYVAGKTGTAQKARADGRGYAADQVQGSFIGYVHDKSFSGSSAIVMYVMIDEPGVKPRWGGVVAAPVFKSSMQRIMTHLRAVEYRSAEGALVRRMDGLSSVSS